MSKKNAKPKKSEKKKLEPWEEARDALGLSPFWKLESIVQVRRDNSYPIGRDDWAYVSSGGGIYLNPNREATKGEWVYIIAHCMLHLGFGHFRQERMGDPLWQTACDMVVNHFLRGCRIGSPPAGFLGEYPVPVRSEEQTWEALKRLPPREGPWAFSTMSGGRPGMIWSADPGDRFEFALAKSLETEMRWMAQGLTGTFEDDEKIPFSVRQARDAREWFINSFPLLGAIAADFRLVWDPASVRRMDIPVAAVSPQLKEIYINEDGIGELTSQELRFVLAHEFLHAALRHDLRLEDRDPVLWNVACDYAVNRWLVEMKVGAMPDWVLYDEKFNGLTAESIYDILLTDPRYYKKLALADLLYGDPAFWDSLEGAELDEFLRSALRQGLEYHQAKGRGSLPGDMVEEIYAIAQPPIPWDVELGKWFDQRFTAPEKHRSYSRLSRRQSSTPDIPRPAWRYEEEVEEQQTYAVILDTSGSMDRSLLAAGLGSIASYSQARGVERVRVVFCDAAAYDQGYLAPEDIAGAVQVRGRGGTRLQPAIDLLEADPQFPKNVPVLMITDGGCERLNLRGRDHAYLMPWGYHLPFPPKGPVFKLKG